MPDTEPLSKMHNRRNITGAIVVIFYVVGVSGLLIGITQPFFLRLFPYFLVLNVLLLAFFHDGTRDLKTLLACITVFMVSLIVEIAGVSTGRIFGAYFYGNTLGIKFINTPVVIGLNWLMLVYATSGIMEKTNLKPVYQVIIASAAMMLYDIVLEKVAPKLDMWRWLSDSVPIQNYFAWFALALIFHSLMKLIRIKTTNPLSTIVFSCQFLFFAILFIFLP